MLARIPCGGDEWLLFRGLGDEFQEI